MTQKEKLNLTLLSDRKLLELLELYERKIVTGRADFEEFDAFVFCHFERNRRRNAANRVLDMKPTLDFVVV